MTSVTSKCLAVDPYMKNAFSSNVKFDLSHRNEASKAIRWKCKCDDEEDNQEVTVKSEAPKEWELDVRALISSQKWLQNYGLKKNRLQLNQILPSVGFKLSDEFDETLKKPVSSRYGGGLFRQLLRPDGKTFNVSCNKDKLLQLEKRLMQAIYLFKRRLQWLTTESRRVFGVIEERSVTIVLDIRNVSPQQFDQYRTALERVIKEQVSQLSKFNIIRACEDIQLYSPECVPVSHDTIENAIQWLWNLDRLAQVSNTAAPEAILRALADQHNEAVYLFTEGASVENGKEILKEKLSNEKHKIPVHVVSFNCDSSSTVKFLRDFAKSTRGKFHAYAVVMELDAYETEPAGGLNNRANIMLRRKTFGGIPPGAGVREDVVLVFEEMEEARNNLSQIRMLIERAPEPNRTVKGEDGELTRVVSTKDEQYMSSKEWLEIYGLDAKKLGLYDVLSGVAFKHLDGVIDIMQPPPSNSQTDAVISQKLVNARYCERFPVVRWKDGRIVHVQVTPEVHRSYEQRVQVTLNKIQQRIDWLNQGSRALFGTLVEDQIYILIDTSASMQPSLGFVKQKIFVLMQEQLRHKKKFNIITFNSKAVGWKDRLVEVSERSLQSAWAWVQNLSCWGSTNTYAALQMAMTDPNVQAIYLLTDGRPDQPPKSIIAQVQMQKNIPIHTISFNCNDKEANQFLYSLAEVTDGRYHYYSEGGPPVDQPEAWESMDIQILRDEIKRGLENLDKLADLRDECTSLAWKREADTLRELKEGTQLSTTHSVDTEDLVRCGAPPRPPSSTPPPRPSSAPPPESPIPSTSPRQVPSPPLEMPGSSLGPGIRGRGVIRGSGDLPTKLLRRPKSAKVSPPRKPLVAAHTKTSLLRTLSSSGRFSPNEWLLPETKTLFELQAERKKDMVQQSEKKEQIRKQKTKKLVKASQMSSKQWLKMHGLDAKRLTILDALGSTFIPHNPKYVPILDKCVSSKFLDDILPIAYVSNQNVRIVNPNGVNLREYESKVAAAVEKYTKRLNTIVWQTLPESTKKELESEQPFSFDEHRKKLMLVLEEADWPVREKDIILLEKEIARGEKFIRQSEALRKAGAGEDVDDDDEEEEEEDDDSRFDIPPPPVSSESPRFSRSVKSDDSPPHSPPPSPKGSDVSQEKVKSEGSPPHSPRDSDAGSQRGKSGSSPPRSDNGSKDFEGIGQVIRHVDKKASGKVKESAEAIKAKVRIVLDTMKSQTVIARRDRDGLYYPAIVLRCRDPRHATVRYDCDGEEAYVLTRYIIPVGGAVARPTLYAGDYVLMRVVYRENNEEGYVPGYIQYVERPTPNLPKFYTVVMYNGQKATTMRKHMYKISKERFELASMYIAEQQNEDRALAEFTVYLTPRHPTRPNDSDEEDKVEDYETIKQKLRRLQRQLIKQHKEQERIKRRLRGLKKQEKEKLVVDDPVLPSADDSLKPLSLIELRKSLLHVRPGEEVLARWSDDGWYYRGIIRQYHGDYSYNVEDSTGYIERIWREDIISEDDDPDRVYEISNKVVALHPDYSFSYVPGTVQDVNDSEVKVEFYDGQSAQLPWNEVYHTIPEKYKMDVEYIFEREEGMVGAAVVVRDDKTGAYYPGSVLRKHDKRQRFVIEWVDKSQQVQKAHHVFSAFTRRPHFVVHDRVLACVDPENVEFLPGYIIGLAPDENYIVKFCTGETRSDVDPALCYWLDQNYYNNAVKYFKDHNPRDE